MKKLNWKSVFNFIFLVTVFSLTVWSVFHGEDVGKILLYIRDANPAYIFPSILCVILYIISESAIIFYLMHKLSSPVQFSHCCLYSFIGFFYCCITPSASGGQHMQVVVMRKDGIPAAVSTVILAIITIVYKLVLILIGAAVMLLRPAQIMVYLDPVESVIYLGLVLNVICVLALLLLVFDPNLVRLIASKTLTLINKIHPLRNIDKQTARIERITQQYHGTAEFYRNNTRVIFIVFLITFVQRVMLFLVTWLTYRSFGMTEHSMPVIVSLQAMISVAADMMPLPGGMGISENLFLDIFHTIFGEAHVIPGMVISRGISYYSQLLISAVMTVAGTYILNKSKKKLSS